MKRRLPAGAIWPASTPRRRANGRRPSASLSPAASEDMLRFDREKTREAAKWSLTGLLGSALLTLSAFHFHLNFAAASFCYLLLVVLLSLSGDLVSCALVSLTAVACLDYFFVEPVLSFRVEKPTNVLALASFLVAGLTVTRLAAKARAKAAASQMDHQNLHQLYELAQKILAMEPDVTPRKDFLELFVGVFGIQSVCLFDAASGELQFAGIPGVLLEERTGEAFLRGKDPDDPEHRIHARCIRLAGAATGAIGFEGLEDSQLTAGPLGALGAAHLERTTSFRKASKAAAAAHSESYRSAILDGLAHEFKTPLSTILAAAGALRDADSLGPHQREMAETVESEAARLSRLTSRLICTARLEHAEVKPWMELMDLSSAIVETVQQYAKLWPEHNISIVKECASSDVLADPELIPLAVSQLLDNACKYSTPGSPVTVRISRQREYVALRVVNRGNPIQPGDKQKIFDRFYRGAGGHRMAPGSGLGLFVARKIALAHGGSLDLDRDHTSADGAAFCLMLPVPEQESRRERHDFAAAV
jgi:two-component system, OmpR family, sensor histidine kinase KdpD